MTSPLPASSRLSGLTWAARRQGIDAGLRFSDADDFDRCSSTDATFQSSFIESGPSNQATDPNGNITVRRAIDCWGFQVADLWDCACYQATPVRCLGNPGQAAPLA
jgi:hypothetical protein